jgi:peptide/nickel transport system permease protein
MPEAPTDFVEGAELVPATPLASLPVGAGEEALRRKGFGVTFWVATAWLGLLALFLLLVPWLPFVKDPEDNDFTALLKGPRGGHLFGTDDVGRDLFSRVAWGGRVSLTIGIVSLALGFLIGGALGITAGFFRGKYERFVMSAMDVLLSFPALILALALIAMLSPPGEQAGSFGKVVFVLTVLAVPALARITRANTLVYSQREFVLASRAMGAKPMRILRRDILPNVLPSMLSFSFIALAILVVAEGALAFLGLSVEAPAATWGKLIQAGRDDLDTAPWLALFPCAALFLTLLALNLIGDKLQSKFSVREANV